MRSRKDWPSLKTALRDNVNLAITLYRGESWVASRARLQDDHVRRPERERVFG